MPSYPFFLALLVIAALPGCTSVCVKRIDPNAAHTNAPIGQRFSLPLAALVVTPNGDGTVKLEHKDLPDPENTFAIDGWSFLARHTLNVEVKEGILTEVKWAPDGTAALSQAATSAGTALGEVVKAQQAASTTERTAVQTAEMAAMKARTTYVETVRQFGADSEQAKNAKILWEAAKRELAELRKRHKISMPKNDPASRAVAKNLADESTTLTAPGPAIFILALTPDGRPRLIAAQDEENQQQVRAPVAGTKPPPGAPGPPGALKVETDPVQATPTDDGKLAAEIGVSAPVSGPTAKGLVYIDNLSDHLGQVVGFTVKPGDPKKLQLTLAPLFKGRYRLKFTVKDSAGKVHELDTILKAP